MFPGCNLGLKEHNVRQPQLLLYNKLADKALHTYEHGGWVNSPTQI